MIVIYIPPQATKAPEIGRAIVEAVNGVGGRIPVATTWMSAKGLPAELEQAGTRIPSFAFPEQAAIAMAHACRYGRWRERPPGVVPQFGRPPDGRGGRDLGRRPRTQGRVARARRGRAAPGVLRAPDGAVRTRPHPGGRGRSGGADRRCGRAEGVRSRHPAQDRGGRGATRPERTRGGGGGGARDRGTDRGRRSLARGLPRAGDGRSRRRDARRSGARRAVRTGRRGERGGNDRRAGPRRGRARHADHGPRRQRHGAFAPHVPAARRVPGCPEGRRRGARGGHPAHRARSPTRIPRSPRWTATPSSCCTSGAVIVDARVRVQEVSPQRPLAARATSA